jgi:competence protein ComEC
MMRYAGLRAFAAISAGVAVQYLASLPVWFWIGYALLAIIALRFTRWYSLLLVLTAAAALYLGSASAGSGSTPLDEVATYEGAVVDEPIPRQGGRTYAVELRQAEIGERNYPCGLLVRLGTGRSFHYGDRLRFRGKVAPFRYPRNPGQVDLNQYYEHQGFAGRIRPTSEIIVSGHDEGNPLLRQVVMPLRRYIVDVIGHHTAGKNRALLAGLLLGEKGDLPEETRWAFSRAGVMHILAVSGLHVAILLGVCLSLLSIARARGLAGLAATVLVTFLYVAITGFPASAVRAGLMAASASIGLFVERRYDALNGLCIAGLLILLASPLALFDVGFQLSFVATAALVLFYGKIIALFDRRQTSRFLMKWVVSPFAVTLAATLGTAPLILWYFSRVSLLSLFANLVVVPLVGSALPLGILTVVTDAFSHGLASVLAQTLNLNLSAILWFTEKVGSLSWSALTIGRPHVLVVVWLYGLILLLVFVHQAWARKAFVVTALLGIAVIVWSGTFRSPSLRVTFLDTEEGAATYVEFPNGRNMLFDVGRSRDNVVATFLESRGVSRLDLLVLSHPHAHVYAGVPDLLGRLSVSRAVVPVESSDDAGYRAVIRTLRRSGAEVVVAGRGDSILGAGTDILVMSPTPWLRQSFWERQLNANDLSLVLRLEYQGFALLLPGDLDHAALLDDMPIRAQVLKSPHQGSIIANSELLLARASPGHVVVAGRLRIRPQVSERLHRRGIALHNVRQDGARVLTIGKGRAALSRI